VLPALPKSVLIYLSSESELLCTYACLSDSLTSLYGRSSQYYYYRVFLITATVNEL